MALPLNYDTKSIIRSRHHSVTHNWGIRVENLWANSSDPDLKLLNAALNDITTPLSSSGVNVLTASCTQVSVPNTNVSTVEGNVRGIRFHQIQTRASTPIQTSMVFYEPFDYKLYRFFELWKSLTVSRWDGSQNPATRLKNGVTLSLYATDRNIRVMTYHLYETFCASAQISDPQNSGALQQLSVTLQSSNYGITVPSLVDGDPVYQDIAPEYLGSEEAWITATGDIAGKNADNKSE